MVEKEIAPIPADDEGFTRDEGINFKRVDKLVGVFDLDNPPEGVIFLGKPLPECVAEGLWRNLSTKPFPRRIRNNV